MIVHEGAWLICNISMYVIYHLEWEFFERYRVNDYEWPWNIDRPKWISFLKKTLGLVFFNQFVLIPLGIIVTAYLTGGVHYRTDYESLPTITEVFWQLIFFIFVEDAAFYWTHRLIHWRPIYPHIHKIHHEYNNTISVASEYAHPIEFLFGNLVPTSLGSLILKKRCHIMTMFMWLVYRILITTEGHGGYEFSWSPFNLLPKHSQGFHNLHHSEVFNGNYGEYLLWDNLCGTVSNLYLKRREERRKLGLKDN